MITLQDITLGYGSRTLIEGAQTTFEQGKFTALMGRNGTGKSTLLRVIAGLARPVDGEIYIDRRPLSAMNMHEKATTVSLVSTDDVRVANLKVADTVALGRAPHTNWLGRLTTDDIQCVERALELTGLHDFAQKTLDTLSDGERQRVMIARALAQNTPIILLDEPTAYLDLPSRYEIFALLGRLAHSENKTILCSTHDLDIALEGCDTLALVDDRRLTHGSVDEMYSTVKKKLLTKHCK